MPRPAVLHVLGPWTDADTTAPLIMSTTATRAVVVLAAGASALPPGAAVDAVELPAGDPPNAAALARQARRQRIAVIHAHAMSVAPLAAEVATRRGRPWFATVDERDLATPDLVSALATAAGVIAPSRFCLDQLAAMGVETDRLGLVRPGWDLAAPTAVGSPPSRVVNDEGVPAVRRAVIAAMAGGAEAAPGRHAALDELRAPSGCGPRDRVLLAHEIGARAAELDAMYIAAAAGRGLSQPASPAAALPTVSVVVASFNRRDLVTRAVDGLLHQTYPAQLTEIVVVDDHSTDGTAAAVAALASDRVRVERPEAKGYAAGARNCGVRAAGGEIVCFTDDDCRVAPTWLAAMVAGFADGIDLVQGRTLPDPEQARDRWSRTISTPREYGLYETANLAVRRSALDALGEQPFDPAVPGELRRVLGSSLGTPGIGEDVDLGWRVRRRGATRFASHAVVHHHVFPGSPKLVLRDAVRSAGFPLLVRRLPELRQAFLWCRVFLRPAHAAMTLALAGIVLAATVSPYAVIAIGPYLWLTLRPRRRGLRTRLRRAPFTVLRDFVELAGCLAGSIYARRLVI